MAVAALTLYGVFIVSGFGLAQLSAVAPHRIGGDAADFTVAPDHWNGLPVLASWWRIMIGAVSPLLQLVGSVVADRGTRPSRGRCPRRDCGGTGDRRGRSGRRSRWATHGASVSM